MAHYKVKIYPTAQQDLKDIVDYLNTLSSEAATSYYDEIVEKVQSLSSMPERYPLCRDQQLRLRGYRKLVIRQYIVFFVIRDNTVQIRRILYGRRQYESLL